MFVFRILLPAFLLLVGPAALAGTISPALESLLQGLGQDEAIKVLVVMEDQADIATLDRNLREAKAALPQRHEQVVTALRDVASISQAGLLAELSAKSGSGSVRGFVSHWLINSVVVTATPDGVRRIAERPDVARVEPDLVVSLISPLVSSKAMPAWADSLGIGLAPGVEAVGAPRVWRELGIDGTGTIVGVLDTGVDGAHPALADRWRGNFAPASACWFAAVDFGDPDFPADHHVHSHGTHVMGTITGLAPGDTIGVAPGARWIAANPIIGKAANLDNGVLASLEFMTDPDGDPATSHDVPDVVQNSWGVSEAFEGYVDCDSHWWGAIDNCEAAGVVLVWAAGNEGSYPGTIRSPADRATTPLNCFSVGATTGLPPFEITEFSGRGPSGCGGAYQIKPEVVAPGLGVYSAASGGSYKILSGTSMAGPHVAGVVALMRQASPDLDVASIKEILMASAIDLGEPGEDNSYGHGFIDAYAAVTSVMDNVGTVAGTVLDGAGGFPLADVTVTNQGGFNSTVTDAEGHFSMTMSTGPANFRAVGFGYFENDFFAEITPDGVSNHTVYLDLKPHGEISGIVTGPDGLPVTGVEVAVLGTPVPPAMTDLAGWYSVSLPNGPGSIYELRCKAPGLGYGYRTVDLVTDLTVDFSLPELLVEDFESGDFTAFPWLADSRAPWTMDETGSFEGGFCARSGVIGNDEASVLEMDFYVSVDSHLQFWTKVSSEYFYDNLLFYLDDELLGIWSGERDWEQFRLLVARGHHNFKWVYQRDVAYYWGEDAAWIDFIEFPTTGEELFPRIAVDSATLPATIAMGDTTTSQVRISNIGDWILDFSIDVGDVLKNQKSASIHPVVGPKASAGGPDAFGYQWRNSDDPGGPTFDWVDISAEGMVAGGGDEDMLGPFALGFPFGFYSETFTEVWISTNGFLSFTSLDPASQNQGIPEPAEPNNMLAAFWDDLDPGSGGTIYYAADPDQDRFIVQYDQVVRSETQVPETFQVILNSDGTMAFQYADVAETGSCTVGIENGTGADGLVVSYTSDQFPRNETAVLFDPPVIMATVAPDLGQIAPGSDILVTVTFDATGLEPGIHVAVMTISSTDPVQSEFLIPLLLTVTSVSDTPQSVVPSSVVFTGAVPNPFNPATRLKFSLPGASAVTLDLFDVSGRRIRSLVNSRLPAGPHGVTWDGRDEVGRSVASGTYFARLKAGGLSQVRSVTLVR